MREIPASAVTEAVAKLAVEATHFLPEDVEGAIRAAEVAALEDELLDAVNELGVGPQAVGGTTTALDVFVETYPTHITALPVAVNIQCHSARTREAVP